MPKPRKEPGSPSSACAELTGIALFDGLKPDALRALQRAGRQRFAPDEVLWQTGQQPAAMHVVLEGVVRVVSGSGGRQRVVHVEQRGGTLGDVALFAGVPFPATAIADTRTTTLVLTPDTIQAVIAADPRFAERLLRGIAQRVRHLIERMQQLTTQPVNVRLAAWLLRRSNGRESFSLGMTQQQLAEELGTVREVVVRTLRELREAGLIEVVGRGRYRVTDRAGLAELQSGAGR